MLMNNKRKSNHRIPSEKLVIRTEMNWSAATVAHQSSRSFSTIDTSLTAAGAVFRSLKCPIFVEGTENWEAFERLGVLL